MCVLHFNKIIIVQGTELIRQVRQGVICLRPMDIGRRAAILCALEVLVLENVILLVQHRRFAANEQNSVVGIQHSDLVHHHQFTACLLVVGGAGAVLSFGQAPCAGVQRFLAPASVCHHMSLSVALLMVSRGV